MKKITMANETPYLPQEIITSILVRLPVKSLIRFRCVCKDWNNLFKAKNFIAEHLHHSTQQNSFLLVDNIYFSYCNHPCQSNLLDGDMTFHGFQNPPMNYPSKPVWMPLQSVHGLLCVQLFDGPHYQSSFRLWNPATREIRRVPKAPDSRKGVNFSVGFGFSPTVNDYKIVKLRTFNCFVVQVWVYSLKTDSWKKVKLKNLKGVTLIIDIKGFNFNGAIFWLGTKLREDGNVALIVSFDIATEVFTLIPVPTETASLKSMLNRLVVYEKKLAMLCPNQNTNKSYSIALWVIEECDSSDASRGRWNWTKICSSKPYPRRICPVTIWRNKIVCLLDLLSQRLSGEEEDGMDDDEAIVFCNLATGEFERHVIPTCKYRVWILNYVESLVPIGSSR